MPYCPGVYDKDMQTISIEDSRPTMQGIRIQKEMRRWLNSKEHSHFVTLNFHEPASNARAKRVLRLWEMNVLDRLFKATEFDGLPVSALLRFEAFPEFTARGDPHYHAMVFVHAKRRDQFESYAGRAWKHVVPSGTYNIRRIGPTTADHAKVIGYATKNAHRPFSYGDFITSNMLDVNKHTRH